MRQMTRAHGQAGQTLVALLAFIATAIMLTTAATAITLINTQATSKYGMGEAALHLAEDGAENAMLRLLRDPNYTGETLTLADGTAVVSVSGVGTKTITAVGASGTAKRTVQVVATYASNTFTVTSWSQIP